MPSLFSVKITQINSYSGKTASKLMISALSKSIIAYQGAISGFHSRCLKTFYGLQWKFKMVLKFLGMHARLLCKILLQKSRQKKHCWANRLTINVTFHGRRVVKRGWGSCWVRSTRPRSLLFYILQILKKPF